MSDSTVIPTSHVSFRFWYNISIMMKLAFKNVIGTFFVAVFINTVFWVLYSATGNIPSSMAITGAATIGLTSILYYLGQVDKKRKNLL